MRYPRCIQLLLAALALSPVALAQTTFDTYRLTRIGETFDPLRFGVEDINEQGEMVAFFLDTELTQQALLLRDGMVVELGDPPGAASPNTSATAINDLTQITAGSFILDASGNRVSRGFIWEAGQYRDLGIEGALPRDINNRGQIVGVLQTHTIRAFLWEEGTTTLLELPATCPPNPFTDAVAINENGVVVGEAGPNAVMWRNGEVMILEPTFPLVPGQVGRAFDVNDRDEVLGFYFNQPGDPDDLTSFLWHDGGVTVLLPLDIPEARSAQYISLNNEGQIVGFTTLFPGDAGGIRRLATLWQEGSVADLNALISDDDPRKGFVTLTGASEVTDSGVIVAGGVDSRDGSRAFYLLTPTGVPAPAASPPPSSPDTGSGSAGASGGGAVDLLSLLFLIVALSFFNNRAGTNLRHLSPDPDGRGCRPQYRDRRYQCAGRNGRDAI